MSLSAATKPYGALSSQWGVEESGYKVFGNGSKTKTPLTITQMIFTVKGLGAFTRTFKKKRVKAEQSLTTQRQADAGTSGSGTEIVGSTRY